MSRKYRNILLAAGIAAIILVIAGAYLGWNYKSMAAYNAKLTEADQLLDSENYTNAILKYQEAIAERPKEEEGYLKLADAYVLSGHNEYAIQTLEQALTLIPESEKLQEKKEELSGKKETVAVVIDDTLLESLGAHSFYDYGKTSGIEKITALNNGSLAVRIKGMNANLIYSNTSDQPDAVNATSPNPDSLPSAVEFDNIMDLLGGGSSASFSDLQALKLDELKVGDHPEYGSAVSFKRGLYSFVIESDKEGNISTGAENIIYIPGPSKRGSGTSVKGKVIDAVTGEGVSNARLSFKGSGGSSIEIKTDTDGSFETKVSAGDNSVDCSAEGYIKETKNIYVPSYSSDWTCEIVMSPGIDGNQARIVLTWGSHPADLDSHLIGNGVHVSFMDRVAENIADLDVDDQDGYGPETVTIHDLKGNYTFAVHDYLETGDIANSGAQVTVYLPGKTPETIDIGGSGSSMIWVVFELNDGKLNVINEIKDYNL